MNQSTKLLTPPVVLKLIERLSSISAITQFDQPGEPQAATLAHAFVDIEESFRKTLEVLLPKLLDGSLESTELHNILLDIGEEFRHILYHVRDPKFFGYLFDENKKNSDGGK